MIAEISPQVYEFISGRRGPSLWLERQPRTTRGYPLRRDGGKVAD
ncbi:MAG TPA: hypothetical protein VHM88_25480 [Candidatus Acidoferrales bacterium]|nr:hypothetical protein [Candidatus Acidoferrales bacterium]